MARTEEKCNLSLSSWVTSPAHPESQFGFLLNAWLNINMLQVEKQGISYCLCQLQWTLHISLLSPMALCSERFGTKVCLNLAREGVLAWMVTKYICLALCSAPPQGHRATSPTEPTATTDGQSPEGFKDFIWCEISPSSATRGWGNTSCKVREFRSFTQENLKALLHSKQG